MVARRTRRELKQLFEKYKPWILLVLAGLLGLAFMPLLGCASPQVPPPKSQEEAPQPRHDDFVAMNSTRLAAGDELELSPRDAERPRSRKSFPDERDPAVPLGRWERCTFIANPETGIFFLFCFDPGGERFSYGPVAEVYRCGPAPMTIGAGLIVFKVFSDKDVMAASFPALRILSPDGLRQMAKS